MSLDHNEDLGRLERRERRRNGSGWGWLAALCLYGCGSGGESPGAGAPPNILLVTIDTLRADHLGCYGYFRQTSPHIDALAAESVLFECCTVPMATTLPSHVSMLTGTWPIEHGVLANVAHGGHAFRPAPGAISLATALAEVGFATAAFISAKPLRLNSGIDAGFEHFDDCHAPSRRGHVTCTRALAWMGEHLRQNPQEPFFLWVHLFDPHDPFTPPRAYAGAFVAGEALDQFMGERAISPLSRRPGGQELVSRPAHDAYDGEILYTDAQVGRLLKALDEAAIADSTLVLLLSDHGESLGQHGTPGHGMIWQEQVCSAWLMRVPGLEPRRVSAPVSSVDLLPTLLAELKLPELLPLAAQCSGVNVLAEQFQGRPQFSQSSARLVQYGHPVQHCITRGRWKLVWGAESVPQLYDLQLDPHELEDRAGGQPDVVSRLRTELLQHLSTRARRAAQLGSAEVIPLDPATLKAMGDLGYTGLDQD